MLEHHVVAPLVRDFALMASRDFVTLSGEQDGTRITLYYNPGLPGAGAATRAGLRMALDALRIFNATFGRYPYAELDLVQTRTSIGGMEYPGLVVLDSASWQVDDPLFAFLVVHEIAHQWWYGLVGNDQARFPWLDEALAQYAVALYIRALEGEDAYAAALESFRTQHATFVAGDHPDQLIGEPVTAYEGLAYFYTIYQKAPLFYAALEDAYGSEMVLALLRDYLAAYRYGVATPADLRASFERTLGTSLEALWAEWVMPGAVG
jgi:aminopeptidase N